MQWYYRSPNGDSNESENHFENILSKRKITIKELVLIGDFNINALDFNQSKMFNPTHVTRNAASAIDRIITNSVINPKF